MQADYFTSFEEASKGKLFKNEQLNSLSFPGKARYF